MHRGSPYQISNVTDAFQTKQWFFWKSKLRTHEMGIRRVVTAMDGLIHEAKAPVSSNFAIFLYYNHPEVNGLMLSINH